MPEFAVTAIGRDRPGIVAAVSRALLQLEGNIEDSQMSILRGHFAVMLIVSVPDPVTGEELAAELGPVRDELGLEAITFHPIGELELPMEPATHLLTVSGADHPGIVSAISSTLAELGVNITDLETRLSGMERGPLYTMMMELTLGDVDADVVETEVRKVGEGEQVEVSLRPLGADAP